MIAKISRGTRVGDIAAYLHGPGNANEHEWVDSRGRGGPGGVVIASNIGAEGHDGPSWWAADLRLSQQTRPEVRKPIWHCSLRNQQGDRQLSDADWAEIGQRFADQMGYTGQPWVMVRHANDHVHIVMSRVNDAGQLWHGRNDYRQAQTVASQLEKQYQLDQAPRRREQPRQKVATIRGRHRQQVIDRRREWEETRHAHQMGQIGMPTPGKPPRPQRSPQSQGARRHIPQTQPGRDNGRGR